MWISTIYSIRLNQNKSGVPHLKTRYWLVMAILCSILLGSPAAAEAVTVRDPNQGVEKNWHKLSLAERHRLAPYAMEQIIRERSASRAGKFLKALADEKDGILVAYRRIAGVRFRSQNPDRQRAEMQKYRRLAPNATVRALYDYHLALISDQWQPVELQKICKVPGHATSCGWVRFVERVNSQHRRSMLERKQLSELLRSGRVFLMRGAVVVPFQMESAGRVCDQLYSLGFPLEAAILAERLSYRNPSRLARQLRARVPFFLAGAADFDSALRFSLTAHSPQDARIQMARFDWMIMAGRYPQALQYLDRVTPERMASGRMQNKLDGWSGFPISAEGLRVQSAMLLYLSGDSRAGAAALKRLGNVPGQIGGAPAKYFARLRLAQVLMQDNPELAHKIAEDIVYLAQEKSWHVLEYRATVLDGWAQYFQGRYYPALINFIKARGILKGNNKRFYLTYTHTMGLLAARIKMAPRGNYSALIATIEKSLQERPYHPAIHTIKHWAPKQVSRHFFHKLAVQHLEGRGQKIEAVDFMIRQSRADEMVFAPGRNPGGIRGLPTAASWLQELESRVVMRSLEPGLRRHPDILAFASRDSGARSGESIKWQSLPEGSAYLLHFDYDQGRRFYLVQKVTSIVPVRSRKSRKTRHMNRSLLTIEARQLTDAQLKDLMNDCEMDDANCKGGPLQSWQAKLKQRQTKRLFMRYAPEADLSARVLVSLKSGIVPYYVHNWQTYLPARKAITDVYYDKRCENAITAPGSARSRDFVDAFSGRSRAQGIWLWPRELDSRLSKSGQERPVYLRRFLCEGRSLRIWDLDRFAPAPGPTLVAFAAREDNAALDEALTRHFSEQGSVQLEIHDRSARQAVYRALNQGLKQPAQASAYARLIESEAGLRVILPGLPMH